MSAGIAREPASTTPNTIELSQTWSQIFPIGPGLNNLGNTCFLNSVLQCIVYTPALAQHFLGVKRPFRHHHDHSSSNDGGRARREFCILCAMAEHVRLCFPSVGDPKAAPRHSVLRPVPFVMNLRAIAKHMRPGRQEDAHEFLRYLLDGMLEDCKASTPSANNPNIIEGVFSGRLVSTVTCLSCKGQSECIDAFMDLALEVRNADSVEKALMAFTSIESLQGSNRYRCASCQRLVNAHKQILIRDAPHVLTLQLKRFEPSGAKISRHVRFPRLLDLAPFLKDGNSAEKCIYALYALVVHEGFSTNSGHYHCFVQAPNDLWYSLNDSSVNSVGLDAVLNQRAYILMYRRLPPSDALPLIITEERQAIKQKRPQESPLTTPPESSRECSPPPPPPKRAFSPQPRSFIAQATGMWHVISALDPK